MTLEGNMVGKESPGFIDIKVDFILKSIYHIEKKTLVHNLG